MRASQRSEKPHCAWAIKGVVECGSRGKREERGQGLWSMDLAECEQEFLAPIGAAREVWVRAEGRDGDEAKASHALTGNP
jgi:hypothetical protein